MQFCRKPHLNGLQIGDGRAFRPKVCSEHRTFGYHKTVKWRRNPAYCQCAFMGGIYNKSKNAAAAAAVAPPPSTLAIWSLDEVYFPR